MIKGFEESFIGCKVALPLKDKILLASNSPRRRELIGMIVPQFGIAPAREVAETYPADLPAEKVAPYLSQLKAGAYVDCLVDNEIIVTADTVVIVDGEILGKPVSELQACEMLSLLSGRKHLVVTGVTLTSTRRTVTFAETTEVTFGTLTDAEIRSYVEQYMPLDKAGAYGIQEWVGAVGISAINGCFYNVMGLPLHALYNALKNFDDE